MRSFFLSVFFIIGCVPISQSPIKEDAASTPTSPAIQATVDLGVILQGETGSVNQWLQNRSEENIHIAKIEKSCDCIDVRLARTQVGPGQRILAYFTYDGTKESSFKGQIAIEVTLSDADGGRVGLISIPVEVISPSDG